MDDKEFENKISEWDKKIKANPQNGSHFFERGMLRFNYYKYEESILDFDKAIKLVSNVMHIYFFRGEAKRELRQYSEAILDYDKYLKLNPKDEYAYFSRAESKMNLGKNEEAILDYEKAIELRPDYTDAYKKKELLLGKFKNSNKNQKKAKEYLQKGMSEITKGNARQAEKYLQEISIEDLSDEGDKERLAASYYELGTLFKSGAMFKTGTIQYFEKCLQYTNRKDTFIKSCCSIIRRHIDAGDLFHANDFVSIAEKFNKEDSDTVLTIQSLKNDLDNRMKAYPAEALLKIKNQFESEKSKNKKNSSIYYALADKLLVRRQEKAIPEKLPSPIKEVLERLDSMTENPSQLDNSNLPIMKNAIENEYNGEKKNGKIEDALNKIAVAKKMNSEFLDLSDCGLMELPESLFELVNLIKLDLSYNEIKEIPEDFSKLVSLVELKLNRNQIQKIPESLFKLVNLKKLYLSNNEIKEIPEDFSKLINLVELELDFNQIQKIPASFCKLFKLEYIDLSENEITEIPESFFKIVGLTKIDLFGNPIEEIISKSEQFLSREKDTVFTNTTNAPSDVDGWVSIKNYRHGLYMKEFLPLGDGKHPTLQDVLQNLKKRGIKRLPEETIQSFLLSKLTEYKRLGDSKLRPFAEARVIVDIAEIDKKVYVTFLPPKLRGRDLEVADVVYELKKEGIDYEINKEVIREALELEKYNNPIAIVNEKEKITYAIANTHNFIKAGNFQNALDSINEAIELGLKLPVTYYNRGYIQFQLKNWVGAIQDYSEAIKLNPLDAENYNAKGRALFEVGKLEEAVEDFSKAIVMSENYEDAYYNRGVCYRFLNQFEKAISDFEKAIHLNGKNPNSYFQMGMVYEDLNDSEMAIANYAKALAITPSDVDVLLQKANLEFSIRNYSQTIQTCSQVVKIQPENKQAYLLRALAKTKSGDLLGALEDSTKGE